jgi:hypothetical protein
MLPFDLKHGAACPLQHGIGWMPDLRDLGETQLWVPPEESLEFGQTSPTVLQGGHGMCCHVRKGLTVTRKAPNVRQGFC